MVVHLPLGTIAAAPLPRNLHRERPYNSFTAGTVEKSMTSFDDMGQSPRFCWSRSYLKPGVWWVTYFGDEFLGLGVKTFSAVTDDFGNLVRVAS